MAQRDNFSGSSLLNRGSFQSSKIFVVPVSVWHIFYLLCNFLSIQRLIEVSNNLNLGFIPGKNRLNLYRNVTFLCQGVLRWKLIFVFHGNCDINIWIHSESHRKLFHNYY